jgi:hypothetical protein
VRLGSAMLAVSLSVAAVAAADPGGPLSEGRAPAAKRPWIGEACRNEFSTLCKDLPNDSRRDAVVACLKAHSDSLSHDCSEAISEGNGPKAVSQPGRHGGRHGRRGSPSWPQ